jgi:aminomethyltransferase
VRAGLKGTEQVVSGRSFRYGSGVATDLPRTPLFAEHRALGARFVSFAGWEMPIQYEGIVAEHQAVRERAGLFDISHMGTIRVRGPDATTAVDRLITADLGSVQPGRAVYACSCREDGGILDDLIVYRLAPDSVLIICNASNRPKIATHFVRSAVGNAQIEDVSDENALVALQGPRALEVLGRARASLRVESDLPSFHCAEATVGEVRCLVARTGYTGEDGVELLCAANDGVRLWRCLLDAGQPLGLAPVGLGARDTLRLEARLSLYGHELDESTHPFEAGIGWTVKLEKPDFLGKAVLVEIRARPLDRILVAFEVVDRAVARHGYALLEEGGRPVGVCTSGAPSPTLGKNIGLGYLPVSMSAPGTQFLADCRGKKARAVVVRAPFYRRPRPS